MLFYAVHIIKSGKNTKYLLAASRMKMPFNIINQYLPITQLTFKVHPHPSNQYALQEK